VAFSPDGHRLASAGDDKTVRVWDAASGQELLTLKGHTSWVQSVSFSPDGRRLASAGWDHKIRVWDAATGQELLTLKGHSNNATGVSFSPDGRRLASASDDLTVRVWDAATGQELLTLKGHSMRVIGVSFSPDGQRLASASEDQTVRVWDVANGQALLTFKKQTYDLRRRSFFAMVYNPGVSFSPDGRRLASSGLDRTVRVWDAVTGQELLTLKGHTEAAQGLAFSPDGRLASAGYDKTVRLWNADSGQEPFILKGQRYATGVSFSPDGRWLASDSSDKTVRVWDAAAGQELLTLKGHTERVKGVAVSPDGRRLATASEDKTVRVWDTASGQELLTLQRHTGGVSAVSFSPDGHRLVSAGNDMTVRLWDAITGAEVLTLQGHTNAVNGVAFSPDGQRLASAGADMTVRLWDAGTGQELLTLKVMGRISFAKSAGLAFSPDGQRLALASALGVQVWEGLAVPDAVWRQRGLVSQVDSLFQNLLLRKEVLAALCKDPTLHEAEREFALQVANTRLEDFGRLNANAWGSVRHRHASKDAYARALSLSEAAVRLAPGDGTALNTLGIAQYRMGRYTDALATLTKSEKLNATKEGSLPVDLAFLAMTQHQLGKKVEAKETLGRLRGTMKQPRWARDAPFARDEAGFLREAEELIEGKPAGKGP
jgi:WD40 repeat protein/Flp pilus assembly protein TadD